MGGGTVAVILVLVVFCVAVAGYWFYRRWLRKRFINHCLKGIPISRARSLALRGVVVDFRPSLRSELKECYELGLGGIVCVTKDDRYVVVTSFAYKCED